MDSTGVSHWKGLWSETTSAFCSSSPEEGNWNYKFGSTNQIANSLPEGCYVNRWREPGRAEADFGRFDAKTVVRNVYILFSRSELPIASENQEIMDLVDPSTPLPSWFTQEDLAAYGALYTKSGFQTALKVPYRSKGEEFNIDDQKHC